MGGNFEMARAVECVFRVFRRKLESGQSVVLHVDNINTQTHARASDLSMESDPREIQHTHTHTHVETALR